MTKSYLQVLKQIEELQQQAERLRRGEVEGVITRIREAIKHYGLSAADIGLAGVRGRPKKSAGAASSPMGAGASAAAPAKRGRKPGRPPKLGTGGTKGSKVAPKYRDDKGNTWAGRGKRPVWLRDALLGGRRLEDFAIR